MSSSESGDPFDPLDVFSGKAEDVYGLWGGRNNRLHNLLYDSDSDSDGGWHDVDMDYMGELDAIRLPRERATYEYDGDMLQNMAGSADNEQRY